MEVVLIGFVIPTCCADQSPEWDIPCGELSEAKVKTVRPEKKGAIAYIYLRNKTIKSALVCTCCAAWSPEKSTFEMMHIVYKMWQKTGQ